MKLTSRYPILLPLDLERKNTASIFAPSISAAMHQIFEPSYISLDNWTVLPTTCRQPIMAYLHIYPAFTHVFLLNTTILLTGLTNTWPTTPNVASELVPLHNRHLQPSVPRLASRKNAPTEQKPLYASKEATCGGLFEHETCKILFPP